MDMHCGGWPPGFELLSSRRGFRLSGQVLQVCLIGSAENLLRAGNGLANGP